MDPKLFIKIEEYINNHPVKREISLMETNKVNPRIERAIERRKEEGGKLYDLLCKWLEVRKWVKKSGKLDEAGFYRYAMIDKNTWSNIRWNKGLPSKDTLLKLVIALKLNEQEAGELMRRGSSALNPQDSRDRIILALLDIGCYDIDAIYEVMEEYGKHPANPKDRFENLYTFDDEIV